MEFPATNVVIAGGGGIVVPGIRRKSMIRVAIVASIMAVTAAVAAVSCPASASAASGHAKAVPHHTDRRLFDAVPQGSVNSDDPSLTGGGSLGYNLNIYNN
jgi:hypothetical protein